MKCVQKIGRKNWNWILVDKNLLIFKAKNFIYKVNIK